MNDILGLHGNQWFYLKCRFEPTYHSSSKDSFNKNNVKLINLFRYTFAKKIRKAKFCKNMRPDYIFLVLMHGRHLVSVIRYMTKVQK